MQLKQEKHGKVTLVFKEKAADAALFICGTKTFLKTLTHGLNFDTKTSVALNFLQKPLCGLKAAYQILTKKPTGSMEFCSAERLCGIECHYSLRL